MAFGDFEFLGYPVESWVKVLKTCNIYNVDPIAVAKGYETANPIGVEAWRDHFGALAEIEDAQGLDRAESGHQVKKNVAN